MAMMFTERGITSPESEETWERWKVIRRMTQSTDVGRQKHYEQYTIQPIDFIVEVAGPEWCAGNIIKYAARYKEKNGVEDVRKAKQYCEYLINLLEGRGPREYDGPPDAP